VNDGTSTAPRTLPSWEGYALEVGAANQTASGQLFLFEGWSDGGAAAHTITTPDSAASYTARFRTADISDQVFIPLATR
jgi:hypothetical protein